MNSSDFTFNTAFRRQLRESAHHYGEVTFLESVLSPGMTVIEGGGNRGVTAIAMAKVLGPKGHLYVLEPVPEYYANLKRNITRNRLRNTSAHRLALSGTNGFMRFYKHGEGSGIVSAEDSEQIRVRATTLGRFLKIQEISRLDFINLDCEGSELAVFRRARTVLKKHAPAIFCEVHRNYLKALNQSVRELVRFLKSVGYSVTPVQAEDTKKDSDFESCSHIYASVT